MTSSPRTSGGSAASCGRGLLAPEERLEQRPRRASVDEARGAAVGAGRVGDGEADERGDLLAHVAVEPVARAAAHLVEHPEMHRPEVLADEPGQHVGRRGPASGAARRSPCARSAPSRSWPMKRVRPSGSTLRVSGLATSCSRTASFQTSRRVRPLPIGSPNEAATRAS